MTRRRSPEDALHCAVADYLTVALPDRLGVVWFHVPNGEKRDIATARKLKRMGVKAGVPDFCFITRPTFFIELKAEHGTKSKAQRDMIPRLRAAGAETFVCRSVAEVEQVLRGQGIEPAGRIT